MVRVYALIFCFVILVLGAAGCSLERTGEPVSLPTRMPDAGVLPPTETVRATVTSEARVFAITPPLENNPTLTSATPLATETRQPAPTATPVPTYGFLRGKVVVDQANCRYGAGYPYLYKYGVYRDSVLEIIGRNEAGSWVLIRGVGGTNACWVKASLLEIRGDVMTVAPTDTVLPPSPYYGPLTGVTARRDGEFVTVSWNPLDLRAGDDSEQTPYVVEAWVCQAGKLVFMPVGSSYPMVEIQDEWGCSEPSHARVTAAEKHGYTAYVEVAWPPAVQP